MSIPHFFKDIFESKITSAVRVTGGDINDAYHVKLNEGQRFIKVNKSESALSMFETEFNGLKFLKEHSIKVPKPYKYGKIGDWSYLIISWIDQNHFGAFSDEEFAESLSSLHCNTNDKFGFIHDNFIGTLPQINTLSVDWLEFYYEYRIIPQIKMAVNNGRLNQMYVKKIDSVFHNVSKDMPRVIPSLLHGDLWHGNFLTDTDGNTVFIDPAIYFGHHEIDLAMMKLFGGWDDRVFRLYGSLTDLASNWKDRLKFYQLYYLLVHLNLFGGSYVNNVTSIIDYYS